MYEHCKKVLVFVGGTRVQWYMQHLRVHTVPYRVVEEEVKPEGRVVCELHSGTRDGRVETARADLRARPE